MQAKRLSPKSKQKTTSALIATSHNGTYSYWVRDGLVRKKNEETGRWLGWLYNIDAFTRDFAHDKNFSFSEKPPRKPRVRRHPDLKAFDGIFFNLPPALQSPLRKDIGRQVRYRKPACVIERVETFTIYDVQVDYRGKEVYRLTWPGDDPRFGRPGDPEDLEFVQ